MSKNRLKMNEEKTEFILIGHSSQRKNCETTTIKVGSTSVTASERVKYLGVWIDQDLSFKHHIVNKSRIAALNLRNIRQLRKYLSESSCKTLVQALVMSHLDYSNAVFVDLPAVTLYPAQRIQNMAAKLILNKSKFDSSTEALHELHWLPIHQRCIFKLCLLVFKSLHDQAPSYLKDLLVKKPIRRFTRSSTSSPNDLLVPFTKRHTFAARSFAVAGPKYWNSLSPHIKSSCDIDNFRKNLKTFLFNQYFN